MIWIDGVYLFYFTERHILDLITETLLYWLWLLREELDEGTEDYLIPRIGGGEVSQTDSHLVLMFTKFNLIVIIPIQFVTACILLY